MAGEGSRVPHNLQLYMYLDLETQLVTISDFRYKILFDSLLCLRMSRIDNLNFSERRRRQRRRAELVLLDVLLVHDPAGLRGAVRQAGARRIGPLQLLLSGKCPKMQSILDTKTTRKK